MAWKGFAPIEMAACFGGRGSRRWFGFLLNWVLRRVGRALHQTKPCQRGDERVSSWQGFAPVEITEPISGLAWVLTGAWGVVGRVYTILGLFNAGMNRLLSGKGLHRSR